MQPNPPVTSLYAKRTSAASSRCAPCGEFHPHFPPVAAQVNVSVLCKKRAHFVFNEAGHFLAASMGLGRYPVLRCIQDLRDLVPFLLRPGA